MAGTHSATEGGLLCHERQQLEEIVGHEIISTRQHWLHYNVGVTPGLQQIAGLKADSTQGFNRSIGFRAGTAFPYGVGITKWVNIYGSGDSRKNIWTEDYSFQTGCNITKRWQFNHSLEIMDAVERVGEC